MNLKSVIPAIVLAAAPSLLFAQQQGDPLEAARAVDACNGREVINAVWQPDGRLGVTCPRGAGVAPAAGAGATNFLLPGLLAVLAAAAAAGGGSSTSGTTN